MVFCRELGLEHRQEWVPILRQKAHEACFRVRESLVDPDSLRRLCWEKLRAAGVNVHLQTHVTASGLPDYDFVVTATYASLNEVLPGPAAGRRAYQFEVCEKPVVELPQSFHGLSLVVIDGPFMCVDPLGSSGLFVMGNVVHAIHHTNTGLSPEVPDAVLPLLNKGLVRHPRVTRFDRFIESAREFIAGIENARHVGSMFTVRTVLPNMDETDARPTLVWRIDHRTIAAYSGKIGTCVQAADHVAALVAGEQVRADTVTDIAARYRVVPPEVQL